MPNKLDAQSGRVFENVTPNCYLLDPDDYSKSTIPLSEYTIRKAAPAAQPAEPKPETSSYSSDEEQSRRRSRDYKATDAGTPGKQKRRSSERYPSNNSNYELSPTNSKRKRDRSTSGSPAKEHSVNSRRSRSNSPHPSSSRHRYRSARRSKSPPVHEVRNMSDKPGEFLPNKGSSSRRRHSHSRSPSSERRHDRRSSRRRSRTPDRRGRKRSRSKSRERRSDYVEPPDYAFAPAFYDPNLQFRPHIRPEMMMRIPYGAAPYPPFVPVPAPPFVPPPRYYDPYYRPARPLPVYNNRTIPNFIPTTAASTVTSNNVVKSKPCTITNNNTNNKPTSNICKGEGTTETPKVKPETAA